MRFSEEDYLKAFPRENKAPVKVEVAGNVIEEAEKLQPDKKDPAAEPGNVLEGAPGIQEGAENAGVDCAE